MLLSCKNEFSRTVHFVETYTSLIQEAPFLQVGLPADREQYIHRLGRTGRKGKEGQGILLLAPWEEFFLSTVKELPITKAPLPLIDPETKKKVSLSLSGKENRYKRICENELTSIVNRWTVPYPTSR